MGNCCSSGVWWKLKNWLFKKSNQELLCHRNVPSKCGTSILKGEWKSCGRWSKFRETNVAIRIDESCCSCCVCRAYTNDSWSSCICVILVDYSTILSEDSLSIVAWKSNHHNKGKDEGKTMKAPFGRNWAQTSDPIDFGRRSRLA